MTSWNGTLVAAVTGILLFLAIAKHCDGCNEAICASVVSKCMLTQSCKCDLVTCTCCKECFSCLSYLYDECCSCVDLCPKPNITDNPLSKKSHVEDFSEPMPGLFQALTAEPDPHERWFTFTFPVDFDMSLFAPKHEKEVKYHMRVQSAPEVGPETPCIQIHSEIGNEEKKKTTSLLFADSADEEIHPLKPNIKTVNCTVAFMAECNSWNKCRASCQSMGATSYRWFHDGCCECIGDTCINYGINESRCMRCPLDIEEDDDDLNHYDDYGQNEDNLADEEID